MWPSRHLEGEWMMEMESKCQLCRSALPSHHGKETAEPLIGFSPHQPQTCISKIILRGTMMGVLVYQPRNLFLLITTALKFLFNYSFSPQLLKGALSTKVFIIGSRLVLRKSSTFNKYFSTM